MNTKMSDSDENSEDEKMYQVHKAYQMKKTFKAENLSDGDLSESSSYNEDEECGRVQPFENVC